MLSISEESLLQSLREGSETAFKEIFRRYAQKLYLVALSKVHSREEAEEIIQNIFISLWEKRDSLLITNLSFYLYTAVRNRAINHIRSLIIQRKYWEYYQNFIPKHSNSVDQTLVYDDLAQAVDKVIKHLSPKSQQIFRLSRLEGHSISEIADALKLSEKAIEYHLTKSLKQLRLHLKSFIFSLFFIFAFL